MASIQKRTSPEKFAHLAEKSGNHGSISNLSTKVLVHGNLNKSPFFDVMWTISMNLDTIAMLPQLWMLTKIGGEVNGMTAHFVAALSFSRACSFAFWIYGYKEVGDSSKWNFAGRQLIAAHGLQVLLSLDFMYYYLCARMKGKRMKIPMLDI